MENQPEKRLNEARIVVNYDDPPRKSPPSLSVGPIGWVRHNLFGSTFDIVLTIIAAVVVVASLTTIVTWSIRDANWLVVNQNFRIFMAGTYPIDLIWRLSFVYYFAAFWVGFTVAIYMPSTRQTVITIAVILAVLFLLPIVSNAVFPQPHAYIAAGDVAVESGTVTELPNTAIGFTGAAGDTVRIAVASEIATDTDVFEAAAYADRASNAFFNAAENRIAALTRMDEIERTIAANERTNPPFLTRGQLADIEAELAELQAEDYTEIVERYNLNAADVTVTLWGGTGEDMTELDSATLSADSEPLTVTLPEDSWYVIQMEVSEADTLVLLNVDGVFPLISRSVVETELDEAGNPVLADGGRIQTSTIEEYVNIQSRAVLRADRPIVDGEEVPLVRLTDNKYRGERNLGEYFTMSLVPLASNMNWSSLWFVVAAMVGYSISRTSTRLLPPSPDGGLTSVFAAGGWGLFVFVLFTFTLGIEGLGAAGAGNFAAIVVWVAIMFFIGQNYMTLGKQIGQPLLGLGLVIMLGQVMYGRLLHDPRPFMGDGGWAFSPAFIVEVLLWGTFGVMSFRTGVQHEGKLSSGVQRTGLIVSFVVWAVALFGVPLLIGALTGSVLTAYQAENLLPLSDMQLWGGFLLTFLLTAVGIVASFPIGVLLALGRRAHRYPAIKYFSIIYIEFVRGVPLVSVLFMASLMVPLLNPQLATVPGAIRAMVGITMFSAAYLAENVRGGLQSIPPGQEEAAKAVGLNNVQVTTLIMLPQALRAVIPALVGQAISLFKDTSLVYIVGLADLTGWAVRAVAQPEFIGHRLETLTFVSVIYFIFSYLMSFISRRIEESGSGSARR